MTSKKPLVEDVTLDMAKAMIFDDMILGKFNPWVMMQSSSQSPEFNHFTCYFHGRPMAQAGGNRCVWGSCKDPSLIEAAMKNPNVDTISDLFSFSYGMRRMTIHANV